MWLSEQAAEPALGYGPRGRAAVDQRIGIAVPAAARVVVAKHGRVVLGFLVQAEREIAFDEPLERFGHMGCGLVIVDDTPESVDRSQVFPAMLVIPADLHLLSCKMISR